MAYALAPLVQRLAVEIGPLRFHGPHGDGEPQGFDGLARRGPVERLLTTEWALLDELPDEFLRRALMQEQTFLHLAREETFASRQSIALFDAGPSQLGSPRILHVAALVVLSRRAEVARATFRWGVLQRPEDGLVEGLTPSNVTALLQGRTFREAGDAELSAWHDATKDAADRWCVGGERSPAGFDRLVVTDPLEPGERTLSARIDRGRREGPEIRLELPPEPDGVRLLRDPFEVRTAALREIDAVESPRSNLVFVSGGTLLLARAAEGRVLSIPVSGARPSLHGSPELDVVAVSWRWKAALLLCRQDGALCAEWFRGERRTRASWRWAEGADFQPPGGESLSACEIVLGQDRRPRGLYALDASGTLYFLPETGQPAKEASNVIALAGGFGGVRYATAGDAPHRLVDIEPDGSRSVVEIGKGGPATFFGRRQSPADLVAYREKGDTWCLRDRRSSWFLTATGAEVVGVAASGDRVGLVVLDATRGCIDLRTSTTTSETLAQVDEEILDVSVSGVSPHVAYRTARSVAVVSPRRKKHVLRMVVVP